MLTFITKKDLNIGKDHHRYTWRCDFSEIDPLTQKVHKVKLMLDPIQDIKVSDLLPMIVFLEKDYL